MALKEQGLSERDISHTTGFALQTVRDYLAAGNVYQTCSSAFQKQLSQLLHQDLALGLALKHKVMQELHGKDIATMSTTEQKNLMQALSVSNGITYDKIRLQDGKSTSNNSHEIQLKQAHQEIKYTTTSSDT